MIQFAEKAECDAKNKTGSLGQNSPAIDWQLSKGSGPGEPGFNSP
jgi:hypothetical protein